MSLNGSRLAGRSYRTPVDNLKHTAVDLRSDEIFSLYFTNPGNVIRNINTQQTCGYDISSQEIVSSQ
jgi:hypothetical protein